jgi:hypothetical protein
MDSTSLLDRIYASEQDAPDRPMHGPHCLDHVTRLPACGTPTAHAREYEFACYLTAAEISLIVSGLWLAQDRMHAEAPITARIAGSLADKLGCVLSPIETR